MKVTIDISDKFLDEINKTMGAFSYESRAEWIREACRRHLKYLQGDEVDPKPESATGQESEEELKAKLIKLYVDHGLTMNVIAKRLKMGPQTVKKRLMEYEIPIRR